MQEPLNTYRLLHQEEWWSLKILRESLLTFASVMATEDPDLDTRSIQVAWANRLLDLLLSLSKVNRLSSSAQVILVVNAMVEGGPRRDNYCFGNDGIQNQIRSFVD